MIDSHLKTTFFASQAFIREFRAAYRTGGPPSREERFGVTGSIINVSSTYGVVSPDQAIYEYKREGGATFFKPVGYSVAKSGVLNFTRWLAEYGAPLGIRANTLVPGGVKEAGHAAAFVARVREAHAARPDGDGFRLQRRGAVPGVAGLVVHDRRHHRRRWRLDGALARAVQSLKFNVLS